jgi:lysophospholipase L1-like esterase
VIRGRLLSSAAMALVVIAGVVVLSVRSLDEPSASTPTPVSSDAPSAGPAEPITPTVQPHSRHAGSVLIVGDSLVVGANKLGLSKTLAADGWKVEIDADEGRSTRSGIAAVLPRRTVPALVVVELGTNPSAALAVFPDELHQMLDALFQRGARRVVWVTPHHRDDNRYDAKGRALVDAAAKESRLVLADWHAYAVGHKQWMNADGLHYTEAGYTVLAAFIADHVDANDPG